MTTSNPKKIAMSFSGKDSVLALHKLLHDYKEDYQVALLFSTATREYGRTSIHGVREKMLQQQADSLGIPLKIVWIPANCPNEEYRSIMAAACGELLEQGIDTVAFGDILLEDVKKYREETLAQVGMKAIFPLWGIATQDVMDKFLGLGYRTVMTCVDLTKLSEDFSGKEITRELLAAFPKGVDICGENGEYHSFVFDGPIYKWPIKYKTGEKRFVNDMYTGQVRFCFTDILDLPQECEQEGELL